MFLLKKYILNEIIDTKYNDSYGNIPHVLNYKENSTKRIIK